MSLTISQMAPQLAYKTMLPQGVGKAILLSEVVIRALALSKQAAFGRVITWIIISFRLHSSQVRLG